MKSAIESLSEQLVLVEPRDLPALAGIHTLLEQVAGAASEMPAPWVGSLCKASADIVQDIIMDEVADSIAALEDVASAVMALEQLILSERDASEITLPAFFTQAAGGSFQEPQDTGDPPAEASAEVPTPAPDQASAPVPDQALPEAAAPPADTQTTQLTGDPELTVEFIAEARDHLDSADGCLLTIEANPDDSDTVNALFRAFHTIKGVAGFLDLADVMKLAHQAESLLDAARQGNLRLVGQRLDVIFDATDMMKRLVGFIAEAVESNGELKSDPELPPLIELITRLTDPSCADAVAPTAAEPVPPAEPQAAADTTPTDDSQPAQGSPPAVTSQDQPPTPEPASNQPKTAAAKASAPSTSEVKVREIVKVDSHRLDTMIDAIGELVIAEAMVSQSPELQGLTDEGMDRRLSHLSKITRELQEMATSLRMIPVRSTFQRMARLARDTSKKLGKKIEFHTAGDETELDKNVVDQIGDPLVHMIRNAVDHGLEDTEEERVAAGKSPIGRVELRAFHKGGSIYIEIADDGRGLDRECILRKAAERGLVREDEKLTDQEVFQLIMEAGFSTATVVSDVSGRGVGMDVARKNIQKMRGRIEIQSTPGEGTTFSIRLPLTLAIIEGMVVRVGPQRYVIPLLTITRMLRPDEHQIPTVFNQAEMLKADEGLIPLYRVHRLFQIDEAEDDPTRAAVVVVEHEGKRAGLMIDELLGQQQIVIKSLGSSLKGAPGVAGGAIMPDGKVGLILDLDSLIKLANREVVGRVAA